MEAAGAVAGFISLTLTLFQSCVQAFELFQTAQHINADGDLFITRLQWEQYRLLQWGDKVGLETQSSSKNYFNWQLAISLLGQLESLLTSAEKLRTKYHLDVVQEDVTQSETASNPRTLPTGIERWIASLKPDILTFKGRIIEANNSVLKRLRWAAMGRDQANAIIGDITDLGSRLYQLLDSLDQERRARVDEILLRNILSRSSTASEVEQIQQLLISYPSQNNEAVQAAASLKQIRLIIGADTRKDEIKTTVSKQTKNHMPSITKLKYKKLAPYTSDRPLSYEGMELARYNREPVLVEWKLVEGPLWEQMHKQVQCLAVMLASPAGKDSQSLLCIGYLPWEERELYALVYNIPGDPKQEVWSLKTLYDLIAEQPHLSLRSRFEIANKMAHVLWQLHTAGWLHKSLRSSNIIYLAPKGASAVDFLQSPPYLIGYEYARPDTTSAAVFTQLPDTELLNDLYRHPQARGVRREKYRKQFDMYALGCILLEIGLWQQLCSIAATFLDTNLVQNMQEATKSNTNVELPSFLGIEDQQKLLETLRHSTGDAFVKAFTKSVLMAWSGEDGSDVSLDTHQAVVEQLQQCRC
ncbi:Nn.00g079220.m01.CDS01 [Neocucurbitaria sp. VM-36]